MAAWTPNSASGLQVVTMSESLQNDSHSHSFLTQIPAKKSQITSLKSWPAIQSLPTESEPVCYQDLYNGLCILRKGTAEHRCKARSFPKPSPRHRQALLLHFISGKQLSCISVDGEDLLAWLGLLFLCLLVIKISKKKSQNISLNSGGNRIDGPWNNTFFLFYFESNPLTPE